MVCGVCVGCVCVGCVRLGFDRAVDPGRDSRVEADGAVDGPGEVGPGDRGAGEALPDDGGVPDAAPPGPLTCSNPQLVGTVTGVSHLSEAALRTSGLTLVAHTMSLAGFETSRAAHDQPFGAWTASELLPGAEDPTFFDLGGTEHAVVACANASGVRHLELCLLPASCTPMTVKDPSGLAITADVDGPSVAVLGGGALRMAFNLNDAGGETSIYLAEASATAPYTWTAAPATALNVNGAKEDDPALSPDGLVLIFNKETPGSNGDLYVSERASTAQPFQGLRLLTELNTTGVEGSAFLAPLPPAKGKTRYELFFSSDADGGAYLVHRSVCER